MPLQSQLVQRDYTSSQRGSKLMSPLVKFPASCEAYMRKYGFSNIHEFTSFSSSSSAGKKSPSSFSIVPKINLGPVVVRRLRISVPTCCVIITPCYLLVYCHPAPCVRCCFGFSVRSRCSATSTGCLPLVLCI